MCYKKWISEGKEAKLLQALAISVMDMEEKTVITNDKLTPEDVMTMPLDKFEARFGFRPATASDKKWFAVMGRRMTQLDRDAIAAGIVEDGDLSRVVME